MTIFESVLLGIVEGITEFLPISSTGHLLLASRLLELPQTEYLKTFEIAIQLGAILSVVVLYWRSFLDIEIVKRIGVALIPTLVIGFAFYGVVKNIFLESESIVLWALLLGGIALIAFELFHTEREDSPGTIAGISYVQSALIGVFQAIAIIPGVSRSAATIVGGLLLGVKRTAIVEFSFLLAVPTMLAATGYDVLKSASSFSGDQFLTLAVGFGTSFVVALLAIKWLLHFVRNHSFISFGVYRIAIALLFLFFIL